MNEISSDRKPNQRGKNLIFALNRYIAMKEGEKEREKNSWNHVISVNLSDFYQLFAKIMRWSLENLWKITKFIVRLTRERKKGRKKAVFGRNSQKLTKSAKKNRKKVFQPKILKFYGGRWTPWSNAPVWAPTSHTLADLAKKSQKVPNEKISPPKIFFKFQKRSKKVEKMIAEWTEAVSEGGNRGKVAKKEK